MIGLVAVTLFCLSSGVLSHVSLQETALPPGYHTLTFKVPHDCGDETMGTTNFTIEIPKGISGVKAEQVEGWMTTLTMRKSTDGEDEMASVSYFGMLPDYYYRTFGLSVKIEDALPGTVIYFIVHQECHGDGERRWNQIPKSVTDELESPAPFLVVISA